MIVKAALGNRRKMGILGNRFSAWVLQRYRRRGSDPYAGVSLTYLKSTASNQREVITRHPVFMTLQLLSQKLYWEQNNSMVVNKRICRDALERQLTQTMEIIRTQYYTLYPELKQLCRRVEVLQDSKECADMQCLLSIQLKRMQGIELRELSKEEQELLERLETERTERAAESHSFKQESERETLYREILRELFTKNDKFLETVIADAGIKREILENEEFIRQAGEYIEKNLVTIAARNENFKNQLWELFFESERIREQILKDENLRKEILNNSSISNRAFVEHRISAEEQNRRAVPALWERYLEAVHAQQQQQKADSWTEVDDRLFIFLNTFQEGNQEERIEFKKFLNSDSVVQNTREENRESLTMLLQQNPQKLLEILEQWQETVKERPVIRQLPERETLYKKSDREPFSGNERMLEAILENPVIKKENLVQKELIRLFEQQTDFREEKDIQKNLVMTVIREENFRSQLWELFWESEKIREQIFENEHFRNEILNDDNYLKETFVNQLLKSEAFWSNRRDTIESRQELIHYLIKHTGEAETKEIMKDIQSSVTYEERGETLQESYRLFASKLWEQLTERGITEGRAAGRDSASAAGAQKAVYTSLEISRQQFRETQNLKTGIIKHLSSLTETERARLWQGYRELTFYQNEETDITMEHIAQQVRQAGWQEVNEMLRHFLQDSSLENKERLIRRVEQLQLKEEKLLTTDEIKTLTASHQEILERPYSYVYQKKQLTEVVLHGTLEEVSQVLEYMTSQRMVNKSLTVEHPAGVRSLVYQQIHKLTEEQITAVAEDVIWDIQKSAETRRIEELEERRLKERQLEERQLKERQLKEHQLEERQLKEHQLKEYQLKEYQRKEYQLKEYQRKEQELRLQKGYHQPELPGYQAVQSQNDMVYKNEEVLQQDSQYVENVLEKYRVLEKEETQRLKKNQERSVQILTEQSEELMKLKTIVETQGKEVKELKKQQSPELNRNQLYQDMMKRMERQLHLERQRRGLD